MDPKEMQAGIEQMKAMVEPWHQSLKDPKNSQEAVLEGLLKIFSQTDYGKEHGAGSVSSYADFCKAFPVKTYEEYKPLIDRVMAGEINLLLNEEPVGWAITRGTTSNENKFIPMTPTDLRMRVSAGRAVVNYALTSQRFDIFAGVNLNLNFPSKVGTVKAGKRELDYGYSSGIYTKHVSTQTPVRSVPSQDEIDTLGGGKSVRNWEKRFDLAYEKCKDQNVTLVGGVAPTALQFGRYMARKYHHYPKDNWKTIVMTLGSVPGINTRLAEPLQAIYGRQAAIREIYGTTEGMFGQQLDENRAWSPNYDLFFFEIQTIYGIKPLYQMRPGELGSLIVSTPVFPRYKINDFILAFKAPYFRCIGREDWLTLLKYGWYEFSTFNFGRL
ncbi:MAG: GH3 auxin-responsive promoter family protein [Anaerolineaceae bacterium]|nr:GH3 auxin-responsive promoter family protein [Anaerolineaceae bacterium]